MIIVGFAALFQPQDLETTNVTMTECFIIASVVTELQLITKTANVHLPITARERRKRGKRRGKSQMNQNIDSFNAFTAQQNLKPAGSAGKRTSVKTLHFLKVLLFTV